MKRVVIYVSVFILLFSCIFNVAFADSPDDSNSNSSDQEGQNYSVTVLRVSPSDTSGLHSLVLSLLGDYNPVVKDYTYYTTSYNGNQTLNHSIEISPDYSWIATALIFLVVIYCIFRIIGAIFSGRM